MQPSSFLIKLIAALSFSQEVWMSILIGAIVTVIIAYIIYRIQKKESKIHKQDHDAKLDRLEQLHRQDSEKIQVLYDLIIQSQKGSIGEIEASVLEQKIELAAEQITEQDSEHAQALKAIADKEKDKADDLLDRIAEQEHNLVEMYTLRAMNEHRSGCYSEAVKWYRKIVELEPDNFDAMMQLLLNLNEADNGQEARELAIRKLDSLNLSAPDYNEKSYRLLDKIILSFDMEFETEQVEPFIYRYMELAKQQYGEQSYQMGRAYNELGRLYHIKKMYKESEESYLKSIAIKETDDKDSEPYIPLGNLAALYCDQKRHQEALALLDRTYHFISSSLGEKHPYLFYPLFYRGRSYLDLGRYQESEDCFLKAKDIVVNKLGTDHHSYFALMYNLNYLYYTMKRYAESETIIREQLETESAKHGSDSLLYGMLLQQLSLNLGKQKKFDEAIELILKAIAIYHKNLPADDIKIIQARQVLAALNMEKGNYIEARQELLDLIDIMEKQDSGETFNMAVLQATLASVYQKQELWAEAEQHYKKALSIIVEKAHGTLRYADYMEKYSEVLSQLGRQAEAVVYKIKAEELKAKLEGQNTEHTEKTE
jgi:tetratricopeptide (TPR) repeat protein